MTKNNKIQYLEEKDIEIIEELITYSKKYLKGEISDREVINVINGICTDYMMLSDENLLSFKGIWSEIDDIEYEIRTGKPSSDVKDTVDTEEDLKEYIESCLPRMQEACEEIIEEYQQILEELKVKYIR